jgi:8-oxo-dGTP pyrophosphatase MutT (NUDIX family)
MEFREFVERRQGAGVLPIAESSGKILLGMRPEGEWATWGGMIEEGENPQQTAEREFREETGYKGVVSLYPDYVRDDPNITFHNFLGTVPDEFNPVINSEHLFADWFDLDELDKLHQHHGLVDLLRNSGDRIERIVKRHDQEGASPMQRMRNTL